MINDYRFSATIIRDGIKVQCGSKVDDLFFVCGREYRLVLRCRGQICEKERCLVYGRVKQDYAKTSPRNEAVATINDTGHEVM